MSTASVTAENSDEESATLEEFVTLVVTDEEGRRLTRTTRRTEELHVLVDYYYAVVPVVRNGKEIFIHKRSGNPISGGCKYTPAHYKMKDGDEIRFYYVPEVELVTPVLQDFGGRRLTRTMRRTDAMQGLMDFYYDMMPAAAVAHDDDDDNGGAGGIFLYRGKCVASDQTPDDLQLKHWDVIYFVPRRRGDVVVEEKPDSFVTLYVDDSKFSNKVYLTIRRTDKLEVLFHFYYATVPTGPWGGSSFVLNDSGRIPSFHNTPAYYEMKDGDEVCYFSRYW